MGGKSSSGTCGYKYYLGMHVALCHGPVDQVQRITFADREAWSGASAGGRITIDKPNLFGGEDREGGVSGDIDVLMGGPAQGQNDYLLDKLGTPLPAFRGICSLVFRHFYWGNNPYIKNLAVRVKRTQTQTDGAPQWYSAKAEINGADANPAHIIRECLINNQWGMGYNPSDIDDASFTSAGDTLYSEGFGLSILWNQQETIEKFIQGVLDHIDGRLYLDMQTGKFALKLLRGDYDPATLPSFNETNVAKLESFERRGWGETVNQVTVVYRDRATNKDQSVTIQNIGNINVQGGVVAQTRHYPGLPTADLAHRVCMRDLRALSAPLAKLTIFVNRTAWNLAPGDVFKFSWPKLGVVDAVFRVGAVDTGTLTDGTIRVDAIEDVFALPGTTYVEPQPSGWTAPNNAPQPCPYQRAVEASYWDVQMNMRAADIQQLNADFGFAATQGVRPSGDAFDYKIFARNGTNPFEQVGAGTFTPTATLAEDLPVDAQVTGRVVNITDAIDLDAVEADTYAYIGDEIVAVRAVDTAAGTITIDRGVLDTVPQPHGTGDRIWFADGWQGFDQTERTAGETVDVKLLPRTSLGTLDEASATALSLTLDNRYQRPYPPGDLKINGTRYPEVVTGDITVSWSYRDRTQQTAYLVDQTAGDIGPEQGTTYNLRFYGEDGLLKKDISGISGTSYTWDTEITDSNLFADDPYFSDVMLLCHFDGMDGSTTIVDEIGHAMTANGGAVLSAAQQKYGPTAARFNSSSDYITTSADDYFGGDFTLELYLFPTSHPSTIGMLVRRNNVSLNVELRSDSKIGVWIGPSRSYHITSLTAPLNTWTEFALTRCGNTWRTFINGTKCAEWTDSSDISGIVGLDIGHDSDYSSRQFYGYLDEIRITKKCRYINDYSPHTDPWPTSGTGRYNGKVRIELLSQRDGYDSYQMHNHTIYRVGYGFNYGKYYGGI